MMENFPTENDTEPAPGQICVHLLEAPDQEYIVLFRGVGVARDLLCGVCCKASKNGETLPMREVCLACFQAVEAYIYNYAGHLGEARVIERASSLRFVPASAWQPHLENVLDIQPVASASVGVWIALQADGNVVQIDFEAQTLHVLTRLPASDIDLSQPVTLHLAPDATLAAVVSTYGSHGVVFELQSGACMQKLYRGDYHTEHCVFSCAFFESDGRLLLVHATDWNRLDISDARTGVCLTKREPTAYQQGEERPPHYLDYFHCGLTVSPDQKWIVDNGWVWHPVGIVAAWSLTRWLEANVWESEDGSSRQELTRRAYYWDGPLCWINNDTLAIWGYGNDDDDMLPVVCLYDVQTQRQTALIAGPQGQERYAYATGKDNAPLYTTRAAGTLIFDMFLFAFAPVHGMSVYDVDSGERLFSDAAFCPLRYHAGAKQFLARTGDTFQVYALEDSEKLQAVSG